MAPRHTSRVDISQTRVFPNSTEPVVELRAFFRQLAKAEPLLMDARFHCTASYRGVEKPVRSWFLTCPDPDSPPGSAALCTVAADPKLVPSLDRVMDFLSHIHGHFDEYLFYSNPAGGHSAALTPIHAAQGLTGPTSAFWATIRKGVWETVVHDAQHPAGLSQQVFNVYLRASDARMLRQVFLGLAGGRPPTQYRLVLEEAATRGDQKPDFEGAVQLIRAAGLDVEVRGAKAWERVVTIDGASIRERTFRIAVTKAFK